MFNTYISNYYDAFNVFIIIYVCLDKGMLFGRACATSVRVYKRMVFIVFVSAASRII